MKHIYHLKAIMMGLLFGIGVFSLQAQSLYITEVIWNPGGDDIPREFVEIRGTASATIAANTYLLFIEGDGDTDYGNTKMYFDLSGLQLGSNGYLAFVMEGHPYTLASGATIIEVSDLDPGTTDPTGWQASTIYVGSGTGDGLKEIESNSMNIILATLPTALDVSGGERPDIDDDLDGIIDAGLGWTIHDGISLIDADKSSAYAYTSTVFTQLPLSDFGYPAGANVYDVSYFSSSGGGGYVGRIGESTGNSANDWIYAQVNSGTTSTFSSSSISDLAFGGNTISEVGGASNVLNKITYTSGTLLDANVTDEDDLIFDADFTAIDDNLSEDFECHDLIINSFQTLTIEDGGSFKVYGAFINNGTLIVENGGTFWTFSTKDHDAATFERATTYSDSRYSMVGSPVEADPTVTGSDLGGVSYYYDETADYGTNDGLARWKPASSVTLQPGIGYAQANQEVISVTGVPNDGTITVPVTHTIAAAADAGNRGFNLVSNPYASAIEGSDFFAANTTISGSIYLWDDGGTTDATRRTNSDYIIANAAGDVSGGSDRVLNSGSNRYQGDIRSFQGFFVHVPDDGGADNMTNVVFTEDMRQTGNNNDGRFFRTAQEAFPTITLGISTAIGDYNETVVSLLSDATSGWDRMYDAIKPQGNTNLQLYSLLDGDNYAIQGLPIEDGISTEIAFDLGMDAQLTLSVKAISDLENGMTFLLHDRLTDNMYDLNEVQDISFYAESGSDQNRFTLKYSVSNVLAIEQLQLQPIYSYVNNELNVNFIKPLEVSGYAVYDLSGKVLIENDNLALNCENFVIPLNSKGYNIVKIATSKGTFTRKFIFQ